MSFRVVPSFGPAHRLIRPEAAVNEAMSADVVLRFSVVSDSVGTWELGNLTVQITNYLVPQSTSCLSTSLLTSGGLHAGIAGQSRSGPEGNRHRVMNHARPWENAE